MGVFARIMAGLAAEGTQTNTIMIGATYLKAHRTASGQRGKKGGRAIAAPLMWWMALASGIAMCRIRF